MEDRIMRTSVFGGFKKDDVLSYVEKLQQDTEALKMDITQRESQIKELNEKIRQLEGVTAELEEKKQELEAANTVIDSLKNDNETLSKKSEALGEIAEEYESAKAQLQKESEEMKVAQQRLGRAFIDARKYSENLVAAANEKAMQTSQGFSQDISKQASEITKLSDEIDRLSAEFNGTVNTLHANIAVLAQRMSAAAMNLRQRNDATFEPELKASFDIDDDATGIVNTDDGSGLTYIQYPPKSRFNEDLDLKPEAQEEQA